VYAQGAYIRARQGVYWIVFFLRQGVYWIVFFVRQGVYWIVFFLALVKLLKASARARAKTGNRFHSHLITYHEPFSKP